MALTKRFKLFTEVLTVRLPMSPEAANEKLAETAFAGGTIPLENVGSENTDRVSSNVASRRAYLIQFARDLPPATLLNVLDLVVRSYNYQSLDIF